MYKLFTNSEKRPILNSCLLTIFDLTLALVAVYVYEV